MENERRTVGIDSGTSFSSREVTPRDATPVTPVTDADIGKDDKYEKSQEISEKEVTKEVEEHEGGSDEEVDEDASEEYSDDCETESEEEAEVVKNRTPFILLKQLVGIMKLGGGKRMIMPQPEKQDLEKTSSEKEVGNIENSSITENGNVVKENVENVSVVNESIENINKENVVKSMAEDANVETVVKENIVKDIAENANFESVVKESVENVVKESMEDVDKESFENIVKVEEPIMSSFTKGEE